MSTYLSYSELTRALTLRDLTDPTQGPHAIQLMLDDVVTALTDTWQSTVRIVRNPPIVAVADNYDKLGFDPGDITRDVRYTRYVSPTAMLRSHTSADIPETLTRYQHLSHRGRTVDELIVLPGLVYRRDVVDRNHVGEPHQVDLWRLRSTPHTVETDLMQMIDLVVQAVLPGAVWRTTRTTHAYTVEGRQVDVQHNGEWLELAEGGVIAPEILSNAGLDCQQWSGLALGMGLDRALMLRKGIPDIRYLRAEERRTAEQLQDLSPWRPVSTLPPIRRDMSVVIADDTDDEAIGDTVRSIAQDWVADIESVVVVARTTYAALPQRVRERLGIVSGQSNALVRLTLRPLERTLTDREANAIRNEVYQAIHSGPYQELA